MPPTLWLGTGRSPSGYALVLGLGASTSAVNLSAHVSRFGVSPLRGRVYTQIDQASDASGSHGYVRSNGDKITTTKRPRCDDDCK